MNPSSTSVPTHNPGVQTNSNTILPPPLPLPISTDSSSATGQPGMTMQQPMQYQAQQQPLLQNQQQQQLQRRQQSQSQEQNQQQMQHQQQQQQQMPQAQQQQHHSHHGVLNGGWQSETDMQERRKMIGTIVNLLQQRKPNAPQDWLKRLPQMAKKLEETLYKSAPSFQEYKDESTLKIRLQQLAMKINPKNSAMRRPVVQKQPTPQNPPGTVNFNEQINSNLKPDVATNGAPSGAPVASIGQPMQPSNQQPTKPPATQPSTRHSDRQQVLRHQQQRLLLLRHAAKCPHEDGKCPVTPHCSGMKRLWKHIAECKDQKCQVPHCVSSRYVLSHYHRCKDVRCPVCGPVREAIHRSHEKQKEMKRKHEGIMEQRQQEQLQKKQKVEQQQSQQQQQQQPPPVMCPPVNPVIPNQQQSYNPIPQKPLQPNPGQPIPPPQQTIPSLYAPKRVAKPQEDLTLINCLTTEQIEKHIESLNTGLQLPQAVLKAKCLEVLKPLQTHPNGWIFNSPVDPVDLGLPDYFQVIKRPMDLGTIKKRLENGCYHSLEEFHADVNLTFDNAMLYNPEGSVVYNFANDLKEKFLADFDQMKQILQEEENRKRNNGDACALCGMEKLSFEPPVFYCNGLTCASTRIRRNSYYYVGGNNKYHWCHQCYQELKDNQEIQMPDITLKKAALVKKKNDEVREESWVHCDKCNRWIHQICGLFNTRKNKDQRSEYCCPRCVVEERKNNGATEGTSRIPMAEDLQKTKLSEYLEKHVRVKVDKFIEKMNKENEAKENENTSEEDKKKEAISTGGKITIRQVTSMDRKLEVRERMKKRYAFKNYPSEFTFRCKCIIVFQNLDGVDVILFGLYVYEHDEKNPLPNKRAVYISYLDSVHFMRPRHMRTLVYHEILISYLDYVRRKGFATAHIWACPPLKGDDYILYAKPEDQKTPKDDRLRQWYLELLVEAQRRGIVGRLTNMYDLYFANPKNDATVVPYMDGDYFPHEVESIIKNMEEGKNNKKKDGEGKKKKSKSKSKAKSGRGGTRSTGLDEEALAKSGMLPAGYDQKSIAEGKQDFVMAKLGETIQPMKESFLVAYLAWEGAREEDLVVPKEVQEYREKHNISCKLPKVKDEPDESSDGNEKEVKKEAQDENGSSSNAKESSKSVGETDTVMEGTEETKVKAEEGQTTVESDEKDSSKEDGNQKPTPVTSAPANQLRLGKFAAMAARKEKTEGSMSAEAPPSSTSSSSSNSKTPVMKDGVLDDDLEEMDCEFLNNRQAFLELCQTNNYQFDKLRRAKHSSMMVLFHLHNRDAPKFVQQCAFCSREILTGNRYHCPICPDFDMCGDCFNNPNVRRHHHQLKCIPVATEQQREMTEAERKQRQRSIQLHMTLLLHAARCNSPKCTSTNCAKMKDLLKHGETCTIKAVGGCSICKRIWCLFQIHARQCKEVNCPVPKCNAIRERFRQLTKQQQAMDDRRRQEMNRHYRTAN